MTELKFPVYEFKLLPSQIPKNDWFRHDEKTDSWVPHDDEWAMAFIHLDAYPTCLYVNMPYYEGIEWSWVKDGRWGAYVSRHPGNNAWHRMYKNGRSRGPRWNDRDKHPNTKVGRKGMRYVADNRGCANGRGVDFHIMDPYIVRGLLRLKETQEIVKFPDVFDCVYCGEHDWRQEDKRWEKYLQSFDTTVREE